MRALSNFFLNAAVATRRVYPVFTFFIDAAFKLRKFELWLNPDRALNARFEAERNRDLFNDALRGAVRVGVLDVRKGLLDKGFTLDEVPFLADLGSEPVELEDIADGAVSQRSLYYAIMWGDEAEHAAAKEKWLKLFPNDPIPLAVAKFLVPNTFERTTLNGSFKVTPALRAKVRSGVKERRKQGYCGRLLVVANKTNTVVSLGLGEIGNHGGARIPKPEGEEVEPYFLTDFATSGEWLKSPDFRQALSKGWITILPATVK